MGKAHFLYSTLEFSNLDALKPHEFRIEALIEDLPNKPMWQGINYESPH